MNNLHAFNQDKEIRKELDDIESLKDFFTNIIDKRYSFWLKKKNELLDRNKYLSDILSSIIKIKNKICKFNSKNKYTDRIDENINYVNIKLIKVNDLLKMIDNKLSKNKESIYSIINNFVKDNKTKARNESLKMYNIKNDECKKIISKILIDHHNKIIQPGIDIILKFI